MYLALASAALAVLPYVDIPEQHVGPIPIRPFGVLVVIGIMVGSNLANRRAKVLGLELERFSSLVFWTVATGIVISHILDTLMYYPHVILERPWELLMIHRGLSSFGGFTGAAIGFLTYGRRHKIDLWKAADAISFGLPFGWFFGRMGCSVVHDHPGLMSDSFFAVAYPEGPRFDLGTIEMMLTPILCLAVWLVAQRTRRPGAIVTTLALVYPWIRFPLDFLRESPANGGDVRYFGFTPGQYACVALFGAGLYLLKRSRDDARSESATQTNVKPLRAGKKTARNDA